MITESVTVEAKAPKDLTDILSFTSGTCVSSGAKSEWGVKLRGLGTNRITLLYDGIPIYEPYYNSFDVKTFSADQTGEKENWPLPDTTKLVCGNDLVSERNIGSPTRITVFSAPLSFPGKKGQKPLYASNFQVTRPGGQAVAFDPAGQLGETRIYPAVFYGRGKGFHGIQYFNGRPLKDALKSFFTPDSETLKRGYLVAASIDGYRIAMSCSELFNRNDQAEFLLIDRGEGQEGGRYAIFPAADFFSDRALKAVNSISFLKYYGRL